MAIQQAYQPGSAWLRTAQRGLAQPLVLGVMQSSDLKSVFKKYDKNGDGTLGLPEISTMFQRMDPSFTADKARVLFNEMDEDLSGTISVDEFVDFVMGDKGVSKIFQLEDKPSEEEAKLALLSRPLEERQAAFQASKQQGLKWGAMTWTERLDFAKEFWKGKAEGTEQRKALSPSKDATSSYMASAQWKSKPMSPNSPSRPPSRGPKPVTANTMADATKSGQAPCLGPQKFGIAARTQEELVRYSLAHDELTWAGEDPQIVQQMTDFRDHLATCGGPLGTYDFVKFLAKGTAGWVFLVENKETGQQQAMKLIRMTVARTGIKEWYISKLLRQLDIQNVVLTDEDTYVLQRAGTNPIIDEALANAGPVPYFMCMVQPLMPWGSLEDLAKEGDLSPEIIFEALEEVAKALTEMHENNIQHKDVKPENIMLVMEGNEVTAAKLCDLGSATYGDHPKDRQDDIRRFGVTIFSVVTGEGWTANRLIHETHAALLERLAEDVKDSEDPALQRLPEVLEQILSGRMNMREVLLLIKELGDQY